MHKLQAQREVISVIPEKLLTALGLVGLFTLSCLHKVKANAAKNLLTFTFTDITLFSTPPICLNCLAHGIAF